MTSCPKSWRPCVRSLKVFLTYDPLRLDDRQYLAVLSAARRLGCLVTVHCENYDAIAWRSAALLADGRDGAEIPRLVAYPGWWSARRLTAPSRWRNWSTRRSRCSTYPVRRRPRKSPRAQARGLLVWGETCPQYLVLTASDLDREGFEGAKFMCSPAPRDAACSAGLWQAIRAAHAGRDQLRS